MKIVTVRMAKVMRATAVMARKQVVSADLAEAKAALDAANEESSADLDAGIALVGDNYAAIKAAIAAKDVDMTGVKPSGYAGKVTQAVELAEYEACFNFDTSTKTIGIGVFNYAKLGPHLIIPETINGVAVEAIANAALARNASYSFVPYINERLESIYLPDSIKSLGDYAFANCYAKTLRLSENPAFVTIPSRCFSWNRELSIVNIPPNIKTISDSAFYGFSIDAINFSEGLLYLQGSGYSGCFRGHVNLTQIQLPISLISVASGVFLGCPITRVVIGANVTIEGGGSAMGNFSSAFEALYNGNGKLAGTYEYAAGTWTKTA